MNKLIKLPNNDWVITSDAEIKIGDWYYSFDYNYIKLCVEVGKEFIKNALFYEKSSTIFDYSKDCIKLISHSNHPELKTINFNGLEKEFGIVDVEKLADNFTKGGTKHYMEKTNVEEAFKEGFQKAQDLNNKRFTLEDVESVAGFCSAMSNTQPIHALRQEALEYIQSLSKTEWNVEVEILETEVKIIKIL